MLHTHLPSFTISIHALAKRATMLLGQNWIFTLDFNPRPRKEGDIKRSKQNEQYIISIHALAKSATVPSVVSST